MTTTANNPLYNRPTYAPKRTARKAMTPAEAADEMLKRQEASQATQTTQTTSPKPDYSSIGAQVAGDTAVNYLTSSGAEAGAGALGSAGLGAAGGGSALGATMAGSGTAAGAGAVTSAAGMTTIPAGMAVPAGYTAVGSAASGGTVIAPAAGASTAGAGLGTAAATGGIAAAVIAQLYSTYLGEKAAQKKLKQGHGQTTQGWIDRGNAWFTPFHGIHEEYGDKLGMGFMNSDTANNIYGALNPLNPAAPLAALKLAGIDTFSGKDKDQTYRDNVRKNWQSTGVLDKDFNLTLADGNKFDVGKDGSIQNYNVDFNKEGIGDVVAMANPLAAIMSGGSEKLTSDFAGYLTNAALSSGDAKANIRKVYEDAGIDWEIAHGIISEMEKQKDKFGNVLSKERADAYRNGLDEFFEMNAYAGKNKIPTKKSGEGNSQVAPVNNPPAVAASPKEPSPPPKLSEEKKEEEKKKTNPLFKRPK